MPKPTPEVIFGLHPAIRWAGLTSQKGDVIFSRMRPGIESLTPEQDDQYLLQFGALIMNGVCQRSSNWLGGCTYVQVGYERLTQLILKFGPDYLAITVEKNTACGDLLDIIKSVQRLAA
jgi:hypothetical protein